VWPTPPDGVAWSFCRSVCVDREPCKMSKPIEMPFDMDSGGPKEPYIRWGVYIAPWKGAILRGEGAANSKV